MAIIISYNTFQIIFKINRKVIFQGERSIEKGRYKWTLYDEDGNIISLIQLKRYIISFSLNESYIVNYKGIKITVNFRGWKAPFYKLILNDIAYSIIVHKGNNLTILKEDKQIGVLSEAPITQGFIVNYELLLDDDVELSLIATFIYVTMCTYETNDSNINFNLGNIGSQLSQSNKDWKPNTKIR